MQNEILKQLKAINEHLSAIRDNQTDKDYRRDILAALYWMFMEIDDTLVRILFHLKQKETDASTFQHWETLFEKLRLRPENWPSQAASLSKIFSSPDQCPDASQSHPQAESETEKGC